MQLKNSHDTIELLFTNEYYLNIFQNGHIINKMTCCTRRYVIPHFMLDCNWLRVLKKGVSKQNEISGNPFEVLV